MAKSHLRCFLPGRQKARSLPPGFMAKSHLRCLSAGGTACVVLSMLALAVGTAHAADSLVDAARLGDSGAAIALVEQGADVNATASDGGTALMWAAYHGDGALVERLLKAHAKVDLMNAYGANALSQAALIGDVGIIRDLLKAGADVEGANPDGQTALMIVARAGNMEAAKVLLSHGAKVDAREKFRNQTALIWAAGQSQPQMIKLLLAHHADANARSALNENRRQVTGEPRGQARPPGGMTPLLYAAREGCLDCVRYLAAAHADLNMADPEGITPLLIATENFHFDVAAFLIKAGADVNRWDWWGRTPLYAVADLSSLPYGGRADHMSLDDTTALKLMALLLDAGANPNAQLKLFPPYRALGADRGGDMLLTIGTTPLARAARGGDVDAVRLLLAHHANPDIGNNSDVTPLMLAAGYGTSATDTRGRYRTEEQALGAIDALLKGGADVNAANAGGATALHGAASVGYDQVVKLLAAHNARLDARDGRGFTPADYALGKAAFGRGTPTVHQGTADLIRQLLANQATTATPVARNGN